MKRLLQFKRGIAVLIVLGALSLVASACGDSGSSSDSTEPAETQGVGASTTETEAAPSPGKKATGAPYHISDIEDVEPANIPAAAHFAAVQATVKYVNEELGGIKGRPIVLDICRPQMGDPSQTAACARKNLAKDPIATLGYSIGINTSGAGKLFAEANVPNFTMPNDSASWVDPNAFSPAGGSVAETLNMGYYFGEKRKPKKVVILFPDVPVAKAITDQIAQGFKAKGAEVNTVLFPVTGADVTPAVVTAVQEDPDLIVGAVAAGPTGDQLYKAFQQQGYPSDQIIATMVSANGEALDRLGSAMEGVSFTNEFLPYTDTSNPVVAKYLEVYEKYGPSDKPSGEDGWGEWGYADVMMIVKAANASPGDTVTGQSLKEYMEGADPIPSSPINAPVGKPVPGYPGIRNAAIRIVEAKDGELVEVEPGKWYVSPEILNGEAASEAAGEP